MASALSFATGNENSRNEPRALVKRIHTSRNAPASSRAQASTRQDQRLTIRAHILAFQDGTQGALRDGFEVLKHAIERLGAHFDAPGSARERGR